MKLLVIGSGMMGSAAAFDMARTPQVSSVTLADSDAKRARDVAARVNRITGDRKFRAVALDASDEKAVAKLMQGRSASAIGGSLLPESWIGAGCGGSTMPLRRSGRE